MKTHSISKSSKKLMAILCAVMMLVSCMVFAPASAAEVCSCGFENADTFMNSVYQDRKTNYTTNVQGQTWKNVNCSVVSVDETQGKAMRMAFETSENTKNDDPGADTDVPKIGSYAGFRLFKDGEGAVNFTNGKAYVVSFKYKVKSATTDLTLRVLGGSVNWNGANVANAGDNQVAAEVAKGTTTDWTQAYVLVKPDATGIHLAVQAAKADEAEGSVVYVDDILVEDAINCVLNPNYAGAKTTTEVGRPGTAITATATRDGYDFIGWYTAAYGGEKVTAIPDTNTTLYAHWALSVGHTWSMEKETLGTDLALTNDKGNTVTVMEDSTVADGQFLKVSAKDTGGSTRPQVLVKDDTDAYVKTEKGKKYRVTFKYYASKGLTGMGFWLASTPDQPTDAFKGTDGDSTSKRGHVLALLYADGVTLSNPQTANRASGDTKYREVGVWDLAPVTEKWLEMSVIVSHDMADEDGYLRLGITTNYADGDTARYIYLDDITVSEYTAEENFLQAVAGTSATKYTSLSEDVVADGDFASHVYFQTDSGVADAYALRMLLLDKNGDYVKVEAGKNYVLRWRTFIPAGATTNSFKVWIGANNDLTKVTTPNDSRLISVQKGVKVDLTNGKDERGRWVGMTAGFTPTETKNGYLCFALRTNDEASGTVDAYFDDIELIELDNSVAVDTVSNKYVVPTTEYSHNGAQTYEVYSNNTGGGTRAQFLLRDGNGDPIQIKNGQQYLVRFWTYVPYANTNTLRYWLTAAPQDAIFTKGSEKDAYLLTYLDKENKAQNAEVNIGGSKGVWQQVSLTVIGRTDKDSENYLRLGICPASDTFTNEQFYVSDISVLSIDDGVTLSTGYAALYAKGNETAYDTVNKYGAMRFLGGYQTVDGDATKAVIGGVTYTVKQRGIILGSESQTGLTLGGESLFVSTATKGLNNYWEMRDGNFVTYSLLIKNIAATNGRINQKYNFRSYVTVDVDGKDVTLYGTEYDGISWNDVFNKAKKGNADLNNNWTK